ncbi:TIGR04283 family arsenosugar biosynthesis glycosyltransferase [Roseivirga sp. E12]|uniref:TIGR04283 family arsenosugar biosynthesis glycosyltransferase n=1 Tax=Roseivirga sp. E12 TaxID=2819237 RepID=UPI001ABC7482|nr:TIGR04283 family arsenosugar biosynthesis glycosyltransferase [Roseivirga sp. E12]MBO3699508.1 TIGR04283 family arsenosugar biosynthesis glycosyltransferase [Roseivirga sp. E12]
MKVSIIIPTFNEETCIGSLLKSLQHLTPEPYEVIVVDGGSSDNTLALVEKYEPRLIQAKKLGRAAQMHDGAIEAKGDILCFLHADTFAPENLVTIVENTLRDDSIKLAGFRSIMTGTCHQRMTTWHNRVKTYYAPLIYNPYRTIFKGLRLLFGDQLLFCRKADYLSSGGFNPEMMILEEADLCIKMNRLGRIQQIDSKVYSSDRRVAKWGVIKSNAIFIAITALWAIGVSNKRLARFYGNVR